MLSDPERRATYDRYGREGLRGGGFAPATSTSATCRTSSVRSSASRSSAGSGRGGPGRGGDVAPSAEITLAEAYTGVSVASRPGSRGPANVRRQRRRRRAPSPVPATSAAAPAASSRSRRASSASSSAPAPAPAARGSAASSRRRAPPATDWPHAARSHARHRRPAGIDDGQRIRVRGEGHAGELAGPAGRPLRPGQRTPHPGIERDGDDLHTAVELTMTQAALGTTRPARARRPRSTVESPPGTQPGDVHVLRGQGMPSLEGRRRGNFHVHARVHVPRRLDDAQRALIEQLEQDLGDDPYRADDERRRPLRPDQERLPLTMTEVPPPSGEPPCSCRCRPRRSVDDFRRRHLAASAARGFRLTSPCCFRSPRSGHRL